MSVNCELSLSNYNHTPQTSPKSIVPTTRAQQDTVLCLAESSQTNPADTLSSHTKRTHTYAKRHWLKPPKPAFHIYCTHLHVSVSACGCHRMCLK